MKATVNPFEPWRPVASRVPPPLYVSRPWRPPPPPPKRATVEEPVLAEPVDPPPRSKPPERPKRRERQPAHTAPPRMTNSQLLVIVGCGFALLSLIYSVSCLDGTHWPRALALGLSGGLFAFMAFAYPPLSWYTRLRGMVIALALAGIGLWFVPTTHGVSLWSAYRQVEALRALPAGDLTGYQRGAAARRALIRDFPSFAADVSAAEEAWLRRTVDEAVESADRQLNKDPDAALLRLQQLDKELSPLEHYAAVRKDLESARRRAVQACVRAAQQP